MAAGDQGVALVRRLRAWVQGSNDPSMAVRAEEILVVAAIVIRGTFVVQLGMMLGPGRGQALHPTGFLAMSLAIVVESLAVMGYMLKRRQYIEWVAIMDLCMVAAMITVEPVVAQPRDMVGSWVSWGYGAAIAAVVPAAIGLRRWRIVIGGAVLLMVAYLVGVLPHQLPDGARSTAMTNAVSILGFSVACRLGGGFVRIMGQEADRAREAESRAAAMAQLERQRTLLHNQASVLSLLSKDIADPGLKQSAMGAAARGARQIEALLADAAVMPEHSPAGRPYLRTLVEKVCEEFTDLPLIRNLDLLGATTVDGATAQTLAEALHTLLWNVRRHADARKVTVHGDSTPDGSWILSIIDDGIGFDPSTVRLGWGLRVQAGSALARADIAINIDSTPGDGTRVQLMPQRLTDPPT